MQLVVSFCFLRLRILCCLYSTCEWSLGELSSREDLVDDRCHFTIIGLCMPAEDSERPGCSFEEDVLHPKLEAR